MPATVHLDVDTPSVRHAHRESVRTATVPPHPMAERIHRGQSLCVHDPQGVEVICLHGALWITHERDTEDRIVERGGRYRAERGTRMWVRATTDSWLCLVPARG